MLKNKDTRMGLIKTRKSKKENPNINLVIVGHVDA
eukprot:UN16964